MRTPQSKGLIGTAEVARRLGMSHQTVLRLVRAGRIPEVKITEQLYRFDWKTVEEVLGLASARRGGQSPPCWPRM